jgi:hypothetical protein
LIAFLGCLQHNRDEGFKIRKAKCKFLGVEIPWNSHPYKWLPATWHLGALGKANEPSMLLAEALKLDPPIFLEGSPGFMLCPRKMCDFGRNHFRGKPCRHPARCRAQSKFSYGRDAWDAWGLLRARSGLDPLT